MKAYIDTQPFITEAQSGDFAFVHDNWFGCWVLVGDLGGHGVAEFEAIKQEIKTCFVDSSELGNLIPAMENLSKLEGVQRYTLSGCLGLIRNDLPLLHYILVGDVWGGSIIDETWQPLKTNNGVIGLIKPGALVERVIKFTDQDRLMICTDGVSQRRFMEHEAEVSDYSSESLLQCAKQAFNANDDSLALVIEGCVRASGLLNSVQRASKQSKARPAPGLSDSIWHNQTAAPTASVMSTESLADWPIEPTLLAKAKRSKSPASGVDAPISIDDRYFSYFDLNSVQWHYDLSKTDRPDWIVDQLLKRSGLQSARLFKALLLQHLSMNNGVIEFGTDQQGVLYVRCECKPAMQQRFASILIGAAGYAVSNQNGLIVQLPGSLSLEGIDRFVERLSMGMDEAAYEQFQHENQQKRLLQEQAKLASMGEMVGAIAHQWRQPLNELALHIQSLSLETEENALEAIEAFTPTGLDLINYMSHTIDDFRSFFREESEPVRFNVKEVINQVVNLQSAQLKASGVDIVVEGEGFEVTGVVSDLRQILMILISNAKDAIVTNNASRSLSINTDSPSIKIIDTGGGVDAATLNRMLEPYFTTKKDGTGTGLGLYIADSLMTNKFKGTLSCRNTDALGSNGLEVLLEFNV